MENQNKLNTAFFESQQNLQYVRLFNNGIKIEFALTPEVSEQVRKIMAPIIIKEGTRAPTTHPIAAVLQRVAQHTAYALARNHPNIIEIGANLASFAKIALGNPRAHACTLASGRDQVRHLTACAGATLRGWRPTKDQMHGIETTGLDKETYLFRANALASNVPSHTFCNTGWENCAFQAPIAIAIHSLYDITLGMLAQGMHEHGCHRVKAWLHFPVQALETRSWTDYDNGYTFKTRKNESGEEVIDYNFIGDTSFGYTHNRETWLSYLTVGAYDTPFGFGVIIEKTQRYGSQFELTITRTGLSGAFFYSIPSSMVGLCKVPNFRELAKKDYCKRQGVSYIVTDMNKIRKLYQFIMAREEKGFNLNTVRSYARTIVSEVKLGNNIVENHWNVTITEFGDLCVAIYILACFRRMQDNHICAGAFAHMQELGEVEGWFAHRIKTFFHWLQESVGYEHHKHHKTDPILDGKSNNLFNQASIEFFKDFECHSSTREYPTILPVDFAAFCDPVPTIEEIVATTEQNNAREDAKTEEASTKLSWAREFGVHAKIPESICEEYAAENQHETLRNEIDAAHATVVNDPDKKALASVLKAAKITLGTRTPKELHTGNMALIMGVPGSGKTGKVLDTIIPAVTAADSTSIVMILCPTKDLQQKYEKAITAPHRSFTIHSGLARLDKIKPTLVIIEEAFTLPIAYVNFIAEKYQCLLVGDPQQIVHVDFSQMWQNSMMLTRILPFIPTETMLVSRRCPVDITQMEIIKKAYPGITTASKRALSVEQVGHKYVNQQAQWVTFTQAEKELLSNQGISARTCHEVQGMTFPSVILRFAGSVAERRLIEKSNNHLVVALTRHTNRIYIQDLTEDKTLMRYISDSSPITFYADNVGLDTNMLEIDETVHVAEAEIDEPLVDKTPYVCTGSSVDLANTVVGFYHPAVASRENQANVYTALMPGDDARGTYRPDALGADEAFQSKVHKVHRLNVPQRNMVTRRNDMHMLNQSMFARLTNKTKNLSAGESKKYAKELFAKLEVEFDWGIGPDLKATCFAEACQKFDQRGHTEDELKDVVDWNDQGIGLVKAFLKTQQKNSPSNDPLTRNKAGQVISAWSKSLNFLINTYTRMLEKVLVGQTHGRVRIMTGVPDKTIMAILEQDGNPTDRFVENDWSEFDSSQNSVNRQVLMLALGKIGCPRQLRKLFERQLEERRICSSALSLTVHDKKDSGAPHTLIDNCLVNMSVLLTIIQNADKIYIKGDDSLARGRDVQFDTKHIRKLTKECNWRFKPDAGHSGNFVSFLVNKQGCALDLTRVASKVLSRCYTNKEDWDNYREAVGVTIKDLRMDAAINTIRVNSYHYTSSLDKESHFDTLLSFLIRFSTGEIPFSETKEYEAMTYITDGQASLGETHPANRINRKIPEMTFSHQNRHLRLSKIATGAVTVAGTILG